MSSHQEYYETLIDLFATPGWATFVEDMEAGAAQQTLDLCTTTEDFLRAKGRKEVYDRMLGYEDFIRQGFSEYEDAENL